jgi:hypothetical protein
MPDARVHDLPEADLRRFDEPVKTIRSRPP